MKVVFEVRAGWSEAAGFGKRLAREIEGQGGEVLSAGGAVRPDLVVAIGGDGTVLTAAARALEWDVPVLGFNLGTLGFLAEGDPGALADVVERLLQGDLPIEERMTLEARTPGKRAHGLNDVVVEKVDPSRLVALDVAIDGCEFLRYAADALVVATPTGSTAYSFSAGGPILTPTLEALVLTPVAPHSLFGRSLVLAPTSVIEIRVGRDRPARVRVDKHDLGSLAEGESVRITAGERPVRFIALGSMTFPERVRAKLGIR